MNTIKKTVEIQLFSIRNNLLSGDVLLSRAVSRQVSSALKSLTSVFGMGTGVSSSLLSPNIEGRTFKTA